VDLCAKFFWYFFLCNFWVYDYSNVRNNYKLCAKQSPVLVYSLNLLLGQKIQRR